MTDSNQSLNGVCIHGNTNTEQQQQLPCRTYLVPSRQKLLALTKGTPPLNGTSTDCATIVSCTYDVVSMG
jgi:hypothetical protein